MDEETLGAVSIFEHAPETVEPHHLEEEEEQSAARSIGDEWVREQGPRFSKVESEPEIGYEERSELGNPAEDETDCEGDDQPNCSSV